LHKKKFTEKQGLKLNKEKARQVDMVVLGAQFNFLGFSFKKVKGYINKSVYIKFQPSGKSQKKLKDVIRNIIKHQTSHDLDLLISKVNTILRGWCNYFKGIGYPRQVFFKLD